MSDKLWAARDRMRTVWDLMSKCFNPDFSPKMDWLEDMAVIVDHDLAVFQKDDRDPVMPEWLESLGYSDSMGMRFEKRYVICEGIRVMFFAREHPQRWACEIWIGGGKCYVKSNPTCGDVRRLIAAIKN